MAKVLKITNPEGINTISPLSNRVAFESYNALGVNGRDKYKITEIDESEAKDVPFRDPDFVTGEMAPEVLAQKDEEIASLKAQLELAMLQRGPVSATTLTSDTVVGLQPGVVNVDGIQTTAGISGDPAEVGSLQNALGAGTQKTMGQGVLKEVVEANKKVSAGAAPTQNKTA